MLYALADYFSRAVSSGEVKWSQYKDGRKTPYWKYFWTI